MELKEVMRSFSKKGKALQKQLVKFRRDLHRYPEVSLQESMTAAKVAVELSKLGLEVRINIGGHGIFADLKGNRPGATIALRADMDALPIQEETNLSFASERPGLMHACGHDAHTTILLGAAQILVGQREVLAGTIRFIFQAAEEINAGAKAMIEEGVLEGVDEIYGLHNLPTLSAGKVATKYGSLMGSVDRIEIGLEGRGGHGAIPQQCIDPIVAASAIVMGLQTMVSRETSPFDPIVITIGSFHAGEANNVIPQRAELTGTIRTFSPSVQKRVRSRLESMVQQITEAYRCKLTINYLEQVPVLVNSDDCVAHVQKIAEELIGKQNCINAAPTMAGEDFSIYLQHIPGCFFWLGSGPQEDAENAYGLHHPQFRIEEECLSLGASLLAAIAITRTGNLLNG